MLKQLRSVVTTCAYFAVIMGAVVALRLGLVLEHMR